MNNKRSETVLCEISSLSQGDKETWLFLRDLSPNLAKNFCMAYEKRENL